MNTNLKATRREKRTYTVKGKRVEYTITCYKGEDNRTYIKIEMSNGGHILTTPQILKRLLEETRG